LRLATTVPVVCTALALVLPARAATWREVFSTVPDTVVVLGHLSLFEPGPKPPATLQFFDVAMGRWEAVANPGIAGREPLEAR
jgi:hypothetical protein